MRCSISYSLDRYASTLQIGSIFMTHAVDAYDRLTSIVWAGPGIVDYLRDAGDEIETVVWGVTGIVGLIAMVVTRNKQRLGDMVAHTFVVRK